MMNNLI